MIQTEFPVDTEVLRSRIIETARSMNTQRLNVNKSGNVSARCRAEGGALAFLITPSGVPYDDLTPEDISRVTRLPTGEWRDEGPLLPSSEWRLHAAVYESKCSTIVSSDRIPTDLEQFSMASDSLIRISRSKMIWISSFSKSPKPRLLKS